MALALVPRARGRGAKIAKSGKKTTTFDPILEGTRRKKRVAGTTGRWIDMRFSKPPGFFPDKLIGYWIEHRASSIADQRQLRRQRSGSRCLFKLFCLFACLFSFDKHRTSNIEHRTSNHRPQLRRQRSGGIEHRTGSRGPRSCRFGARPKRQGAACLTVLHWK